MNKAIVVTGEASETDSEDEIQGKVRRKKLVIVNIDYMSLSWMISNSQLLYKVH